MIRRFVTQSWGILLILSIWQIWVVSKNYNSIVIVSPLVVLRDMMFHPLIYGKPALWTLCFAIGGLCAGMLLGVMLAIAAWFSPVISGLISPAALLLSSTPIVCLIPILARILGYDSRTEFVTVVVMTYFPSFVFASQGLRALPPMSGELFSSLAATYKRRLVLLALPAAVPSIAIAVRVGAAYGVLVAMVSEYLMQTGGLGNMFALATQAFETERAWGASLTAIVLSASLYSASGALETSIRRRYS